MASAKYKRGKDGYFQAKVWDGTYTDGKKHYVSLRSTKSSKDLEQKVNAFTARVESRQAVHDSGMTFSEYARMWRSVYKAQCESNTKNMYDNIIEKHFSILSTATLSSIDRIHLQTLINNAEGMPRTQQQIYITFKQVILSAVSDHLFPANVADDIFRSISCPKYRPPEKRPLTSYEREALFKASFSQQDKVFVYLLYGCGIRRGEALALTIFDINTNTHELTINKSHKFVNDKPVQKPPKSDNGYRTIPIPDKVFPDIKLLIDQKRSCRKTYLFTMRNGLPMTKSSYDRMWARIVSRMQDVSTEEIVGLTAHVFRHNYCTNLCYQIPMVSIKNIAALMGDTEKMVLEVYNHIVLEKEDSAKAVNAALG